MSMFDQSSETTGRGGRMMRPALGLILALATAYGSAGCAAAGGGIVARDVLEIKQMVSQQKEDGDASGRKIEYRLDTLDSKIQERSDQMKAQLDEMDQIIRTQAKDIERLRRQLEGSSVANSTPMTAPSMTPAPADTAAAASGTPAATSAAPGIPTTDTTYTDALKNFNLGRYDQAKPGFEAVLASGVSGDQAIQTRFWLAETCYALNDMVGAYNNYTTLIKANPSHSLAWQGLERMAEISAKQGRNADALKLYNQIIEKNPSYPAIDRVKEKATQLQGAAAAPAPAAAAAPPVAAPAAPAAPPATEAAPAAPASPGN